LTNAEALLIPLTRKEYALLTAFLDAPQRPLSREYLLHATRVHEDVFDRSIDVSVLRLRRKLEPNPGAPRIIQTDRGVGYRFCLPIEAVQRNVNFSRDTSSRDRGSYPFTPVEHNDGNIGKRPHHSY
jgi:DNA-binding winged helix-turn-helix (wHTH) protein